MSELSFRGHELRFLLRIAKAVSLGFLLAVLWLIVPNGSEKPNVGGDFAAFYGASLMVLQGENEKLYDFERQKAVQQSVVPGLKDQEFQPFPYPPPVVALYLPFGLFSFEAAFWIHTALAVLAVFISAFLILKIFPEGKALGVVELGCLLLIFFPLTRAVFGGQNTSFSLLLIWLSFFALHRKAFLGAGIVAALLLYKPQFAFPLLAVVIARGGLIAFSGACLVSILWYIAGVQVSGLGWPEIWYSGVSTWHASEITVSRGNLLSLSEIIISQSDSRAAWFIVTLSLYGIVCVGLFLYSWRTRFLPIETFRFFPLVFSALTLLAAPHAVYYDAGLLSGGLVVSLLSIPAFRGVALCFFWLAAWSFLLLEHSAINPLLLVCLLALGVPGVSSALQKDEKW